MMVDSGEAIVNRGIIRYNNTGKKFLVQGSFDPAII